MLHTHCWYPPKTLACLLNWPAILKKKNLHLQVCWSHLDTLAQKFHQHRHSMALGWEEHLKKKNTLMEHTSPVRQSPCCVLIRATAEEHSLFYTWVLFSSLHLSSQCWTEKRTRAAVDLHPIHISSVDSFPRHKQTLTFSYIWILTVCGELA